MSNQHALYTKREAPLNNSDSPPAMAIVLGTALLGSALALFIVWNAAALAAVFAVIALVLITSGGRELLKRRRRTQFIRADRTV
jgi:hypothetical protein